MRHGNGSFSEQHGEWAWRQGTGREIAALTSSGQLRTTGGAWPGKEALQSKALEAKICEKRKVLPALQLVWVLETAVK